MSEHVIRTDQLRKSFGRSVALDGLDLEVAPGEVHGFLGPNGAGKSTTIRILLGLIRRSGGTAELFGQDPWHDAAHLHGRLAYVPGDVALWPGLTGGECLDVLGSTYGGVDRARRDELVAEFELDPTKKVRDYSKGNRQKVALVAALSAQAELLILDEPTSGLDPLREQTFQSWVRRRRDEGCTVLLSSHILSEVEALADRVSIIRLGRTVSTGSLAGLRKHARTEVSAMTRSRPDRLDAEAGVSDLELSPDGGSVSTRFRVDARHLDAAVGQLHRAGIVSLTVTPPTLQELFLSEYGDQVESDSDESGRHVDHAATTGATR
ncbi:MAG: ABC transporter ATP-binding protein [Nocardioides sp.]